MQSIYNATDLNYTIDDNGYNETSDLEDSAAFEAVVRIVVPIFFSIICFLGFFGNLLVIIVVIFNHQMRNTTNLLILNLAFADMFFIIICVPFTATTYALPIWPFGDAWCKIYQYILNVTAYASVYTLVLMSLDRYLAVVHPISSMTLRTDRNACIMILISWGIICLANIPILIQYSSYSYVYGGQSRSTCINLPMVHDPKQGKLFYGCFFAFCYVIPLTLVVVLYGAMLKRLLHGVVPRGSQSGEGHRSKRRVTRMVVVVVVMFALAWLPFQVIFMVQFFGTYPTSTAFIGIKIACTCFAYMNSCVNPFLYAFFSENFRKSFRKVLSFGTIRYNRYEFERTNTRAMDPLTRQTRITEENGV